MKHTYSHTNGPKTDTFAKEQTSLGMRKRLTKRNRQRVAHTQKQKERETERHWHEDSERDKRIKRERE